MAPIDLKKNQNEILKIHKEVSDPKSNTNWALFGYEGKSGTLEVVSKGDGGVEEFLQELNSGRIMYGYLKVIDPNSNLPKFVFVNWQGEGVPEMVKGSCASHVREVSNLLKGAHVSINARNEDDVDEETIKSKVSKSSGANYSVHKEQKKDLQPSGPVGSVYEKTKPQIELKPVLREKFWEDAAREEQNRKEMERKRLDAEREKLDKELKERELQDARKREERENIRLKQAKEIKSANQQADAHPKQDKSIWEREQVQAKKDEEERGERSNQLGKNRAQEAQNLIASATSQARSVFMQKPTSQFDTPKEPAPPRKLKTAFHDSEDKMPVHIAICPPKIPELVPISNPEDEIYDDGQTVQAGLNDNTDEIYDDGGTFQKDAQGHVEDFYDDVSSHPKSNIDIITEGLPKRVEQDSEETYESLELESGDAIYDDAETLSKPEGVCAVALYDYQAAEENEITFDPGDRIMDIDMIDDGWWIGTDKEGKRGMFPSNYVELIN